MHKYVLINKKYDILVKFMNIIFVIDWVNIFV